MEIEPLNKRDTIQVVVFFTIVIVCLTLMELAGANFK